MSVALEVSKTSSESGSGTNNNLCLFVSRNVSLKLLKTEKYVNDDKKIIAITHTDESIYVTNQSTVVTCHSSNSR